jgi:hypothetical protein
MSKINFQNPMRVCLFVRRMDFGVIYIGAIHKAW